MSRERKPGNELPKSGVSIFSLFSGTMLSEQDIKRLQRPIAERVDDETLDKPQTQNEPRTNWEARKALALRGTRKLLKQLLIPDEYSVFITKKAPRK